MNDIEGPMYPLEVKIGTTRTVCYLGSQVEFEKAQGFANFLGIGRITDKDRATMPQDRYFGDAAQFRKGVMAEILGDPGLRVAHCDALDAMFQERIFEVRDALRAQGWYGAGYDILTKDGASALFKFDHAPNGRNVIGMSVNGVEDICERPAAEIAAEVTQGAQDHLRRNRRVDVVIVTNDGCEGSYNVKFDDADKLAETQIKWKPETPDGATQEVRLRLRSYGRFDGDPYVLGGDTWRVLESDGQTNKLFESLLSGAPAERAVQAALGIAEKPEPSTSDELEAARRTAAKYGLTNTRVAGPDEKLPSIGPVMAITTAYVVQNIGMNNAVLHHVSSFDQLPVLGGRFKIRHEAGKAVVQEGRTQAPLFSR